ncbi:MAG: hypothetical protein JW923_00050 [Spirochaetales bacterium]|nr:hypothetical protein [Spirochaetales bacterium]
MYGRAFGYGAGAMGGTFGAGFAGGPMGAVPVLAWVGIALALGFGIAAFVLALRANAAVKRLNGRSVAADVAEGQGS